MTEPLIKCQEEGKELILKTDSVGLIKSLKRPKQNM
jgi:hypothetical protein